ncbi:MAG TPA: zf-HC2 domain-containing protein [Candidatus Acidoferrales bacterium]|nr:zf-HC2 domain-containing protein [Candidatus Acidoferrales bacterium]
MTCREVVEFLAEYLAGELPPEQHKAFREHLGGCTDCVTYLKGYEDAIRLGKVALSQSDRAVPDDVPEELVQAILAARSRRS